MKRITLAGILAIIVSSLTASANAGFLVILDENPFNGGERGFFKFDLDTRDLSLISELAYPSDRFEGLAADVHGRLYAGSEFGRLWRFKLETGDPTLVGQVPVSEPLGSRQFIRGVTFHPKTNELYGFGFNQKLYRIDPLTAQSVEIGIAPGLDGGMAFMPDGRLLGIGAPQNLISIDPLTGATSLVSDTPLPVIQEIDASPDGRLFGINYSRGSVYEINPDTGESVELARFGEEHANGFISIAYVPEPASAALALTLLLGLAAKFRTTAIRSRR